VLASVFAKLETGLELSIEDSQSSDDPLHLTSSQLRFGELVGQNVLDVFWKSSRGESGGGEYNGSGLSYDSSVKALSRRTEGRLLLGIGRGLTGLLGTSLVFVVDDDDGDGSKVPTGNTEEGEVLKLGGGGSKRNWRSGIAGGSGREWVVETEFFDVDGTLGRGRIVCIRGDCV